MIAEGSLFTECVPGYLAFAFTLHLEISHGVCACALCRSLANNSESVLFRTLTFVHIYVSHDGSSGL